MVVERDDMHAPFVYSSLATGCLQSQLLLSSVCLNECFLANRRKQGSLRPQGQLILIVIHLGEVCRFVEMMSNIFSENDLHASFTCLSHLVQDYALLLCRIVNH